MLAAVAACAGGGGSAASHANGDPGGGTPRAGATLVAATLGAPATALMATAVPPAPAAREKSEPPISLPPRRPPSQTADLMAVLEAVTASMPRAGSEAFVAPREAEIVATAAIVEALVARAPGRAVSIAGEGGYSLALVADAGEAMAPTWVLRDEDPTLRGWGLYYLRQAPTNGVIVEAPHPLADERTALVALEVYRAVGAEALLVAGAHRHANRDGAADAAHSQRTIFQAVHEALPKTRSTVILQIHGFSTASRPEYPQVILGAGPGATGDLAARLVEELGARSVDAVECNGLDWRDLCGVTNLQSRRSAPGLFIHIELDEDMRQRPDDLVAAVRAVVRP